MRRSQKLAQAFGLSPWLAHARCSHDKSTRHLSACDVPFGAIDVEG